MVLLLKQVFVASCVFLLGTVAILHPTVAEEPGRFIRVGMATLTPQGWADFCSRYRDECKAGQTVPRDVEATAANLALIDMVNRRVNRQLQPKSDHDHWSLVDRWDLPSDGMGDCEDYALLKRKLLIDSGIPRQALLMTIVRDEMNEGHAVLTVKTTRGEFVLDNMNDELKIWSRTPYRFVKRQSQEDQNVWVAIGSSTLSANVMIIQGAGAAGRAAGR
jgi:predicted transglutaminase-like cysteine proteinase